MRLVAVPFALLEAAVEDYPAGDRLWAWAIAGGFAAGAVMLAVRPLPLAALALDTAVASAFVVLYAFEPGTAVRHLLLLPVVEAGLLRGRLGAAVVSVATVPALVLFEWRHPTGFDVGHVLGPLGIELLVGLVVGALSGPVRSGGRPRPS